MLHSHQLFSRFSPFPPLIHPRADHPPFPLLPPTSRRLPACPSSIRSAGLHPLLAELPIPQITEDGPIQLPPSSPSTLFAVDDNPSPLQVATSVLLTGAISVFLFRSLRRRARRAKELTLRSTGMKKAKDMKEEALDSLKAMGVAAVEPGKPPSPVQALLGAVAAGVIAVILYKFATTVEASLNRQTISDNFSVRQITITVRTIVNGLCYLATFVFGINSIGLFLYSIQLGINSFSESPADSSESGKEDSEQLNAVTESTKGAIDNVDSKSRDMQESSDES